MTDREKLAIGFFRRGIGCAQAIMCAYAKELSISHEEALRMAEEYAAGTYLLCGPVMAMHVILHGLLNKGYSKTPYELTGAAKEHGARMDGALEKQFGSLACRELRAEKEEGKELICIRVISAIVTLLDAFLIEQQNQDCKR